MALRRDLVTELSHHDQDSPSEGPKTDHDRRVDLGIHATETVLSEDPFTDTA